jgi:hypothetical protein
VQRVRAGSDDRRSAGVTYEVPRSWRPPPVLYRWQRVILRLVIAAPGATTEAIGDGYYPRGGPSARAQVALHELRILAARNLVQRDRGRWSPALLASETLRRSGRSGGRA